MLFSVVLFFILLIILFFYIAAKLSVKLENTPYNKMMFVLLFISFLTVIEIVFCFYLYVKFRTKDGEEGPRGFQGHPGVKGDKGNCDDNCHLNVIIVMIQKIFEKKLGRILSNEERGLIVNEFKGITNHNNKDIKVHEIKKLHQEITQKVELGYYKITGNSLQSLKTTFKFT
jgi:hypothetical protein